MFPPVLLFSLGLGTFVPQVCLSGDSEPHVQGRPRLRSPAGSVSAVSAPDGRPGRGPGDTGTGRDGPPWDAAQARGPRGGAPESLLPLAQASSLADALAPI